MLLIPDFPMCLNLLIPSIFLQLKWEESLAGLAYMCLNVYVCKILQMKTD